MVKMHATVKRDLRYKGKLEALRKRVKGSGVEVGVLAGTGEHPNGTGGQTIAEIAVWNEFGTQNAKHPIPARPFMRATVRLRRRAYRDLLRRLLHNMVLGKVTTDQAQAVLGMTAQRDIRNTIRKLKSPRNKAATVKRKGSSNPLIDIGILRQSIHWARLRRVTRG